MYQLKKVFNKDYIYKTEVISILSLSAGVIIGVVFKSRINRIISKLGLNSSGIMQQINRPESGSQFEKALPRGNHPIQLYSLATPNGQKVTIALELMGLKYDAFLINIMKKDQFGSGFTKLNPNSKIPSMIHYTEDHPEGIQVFESASILLYLAELTGKFLPKDTVKKTEVMNWLFFQVGAAPYFGNFGHFYVYAPKTFWNDHTYGIARFKMEVQRLLDVLNKKLQNSKFLCGDEITIADFAWYPWVICIDTGYKAKQFIGLDSYKNVTRWIQDIESINGVEKGLSINSTTRLGGKNIEYHSE